MANQPNTELRSKPKTYRWLTWLLRVIVPVMALPPFLWSVQKVPNLEPVPSRVSRFIDDWGMWITGIGLMPKPEFAPQGLPTIWCVSGQDSFPFGDTFNGFLFDVNGYVFPLVTFDNFQDSEFNRNPYEFYEDYYDEIAPPSQDERVALGFGDEFDELDCELSRPRTIQNLLLYGSGGILALILVLVGGWSSVRFDGGANPVLEYASMTTLSLVVLVASGSVLAAVPLVMCGALTGYLFWKRDVL